MKEEEDSGKVELHVKLVGAIIHIGGIFTFGVLYQVDKDTHD